MALLKLAAYLDEAHDDPIEAIKVIKDSGIHHVALRTVWSTPVHLVKDQLISSLKQELAKHDVSPVIISSSIGNTDSSKLSNINDGEIERVMQIATFMKLNVVKFGIGVPEQYNNSVGYRNDAIDLEAWAKRLHNLAINYGMALLYETKRQEISIDICKLYPKWKIAFDPANYVASSAVDVYNRYAKIKSNLGVVELHDYLTGVGHKPAGFGHSKLKQIIQDCENSNYSGWYILKHSLGRKYASYKTRHEVFMMAKQALDTVLEI